MTLKRAKLLKQPNARLTFLVTSELLVRGVILS